MVLPLPGTELEIGDPRPIDEAGENSRDGGGHGQPDASRAPRAARPTRHAQPRAIRGAGEAAAAMFQRRSTATVPAIPFDRVPYVPRDLRRVAIMASLMIVLILIAAFVVTRINP